MNKDKFAKDFFGEGASLWMKVAGAAIATPLIVFAGMSKGARRSGEELPVTGVNLALLLAGAAVLGAFLGAALSLKDVVAKRMANHQPVPWPLKLLFGRGALSLLVWFLLIFVGTFFGIAIMAAFSP